MISLPFVDQLPEELLVLIEEDIRNHLFQTWYDNLADEGVEALEREFMMFAPNTIRAQYNEFYGLSGDEALHV